MKDKIIIQSIESLRSQGLKFSVDTIAQRLNISKKTIYKFFPNKEALAVAIYERYYSDIHAKAKALSGDKSQAARYNLLYLYFDAKSMTRSEIFNKYKLNDALRTYTNEQNDRLFKVVYRSLTDGRECEEASLRIIIDGAFEKLCAETQYTEEVINILIKTLL